MTSKPTEPCPGCDEGWRVIGKPFCSECYEGQITKLRAERDAAARDMRERCAKVEGVEGDVETATCAFEGGYLVGFNDCHYRFSAAIRALPLAVVATDRKDRP